MDDEMQLRLLGAHGDMDPRALHRALGDLLALLDGPSGVRAAAPSFVVSTLAEGSMKVAVRPRGHDAVAARSLERLWDGVGLLIAQSVTPTAWDRTMLEHLISLGDVTDLPGVDGAELSLSDRGAVRIDGPVQAHARESLHERRTSIGSVRGRLDRWVDRGRHHEVGLIDEATGRAIQVDVPVELKARVRAALDETVLAWGLVRRNENGDKLRLRLEDFEVVEKVASTSVDDMIGYLGDWTDGVDSVEWVRAQRAD